MAPIEMKNSVVGVWKLLRFEFQAEGNRIIYPFGKEAHGSFIYTKSNRFSVQLMRVDRPKFQIADQQQGTVEETLASYRGSISYFGTYQVDEEKGIIIHFVEGSIFPNMEGTEQIRYFELKENILQLRTPTFKVGGEVTFGILLWERIK
jgi:hypothetical protein